MFEFTGCDFVANFLSGVPEAFGDECRADVRSFGELADFAFPAADEDWTATGARGGFEVGDAVADHVAIFQIDAHIGCGLLEHRDAGLAAVAFLAELADLCFGMMQAIVDVIDAAACFSDGGENGAFEGFQRFTFEMALGDAGLIGNDGDVKTEIVEEANRLWNAGQQLELRTSERRIDYACVLVIDQGVDYTVAIKEDCFHRKKG